MITGKINFSKILTETIPMGGGLNEQVTNTELKRGELIFCKNYLEQYGTYHGYSSIPGYERYDGQTSPDSIALDDYDTKDDTSREAARTAITEVPGEGNITGIHIYDSKVFAFRNIVGGTNGAMFEAVTSQGWQEVTTDSNIEPSGYVRAVNGRFSNYNSNDECMFWVDGVSPVLTYDGTTVTTIVPDAGITDNATHIGVWKNRLFVVYPKGHVLFSNVGDPTDWDASTGNAGEIYLGADVTNVREAPGGTLIFTTRKSVHVLQYGTTDETFIFKQDVFSSTTGAIEDTATDLLGSVYYVDDQGLTSLDAVSAFGDFEAKTLGQKVYKTFNQNKAGIIGGFVDRNTNRYYLLYNDSHDLTKGLVFTFKDKFVKGATKIVLGHKMVAFTEGSFNDGTNRIFLGSDDGFIYEFLKGTSFDGETIDTRLTTSFYHYGSYRIWKSFRRLFFEMTAEHGLEMEVFTDYDYGARKLHKADTLTEDVAGSGGIWGQSIWGRFIWSARALSTAILYNIGLGTNMAITINTSDKYREPHTIHNITVDFIPNGVQQ